MLISHQNANQRYEEFVTDKLKIEILKYLNNYNKCNFIITGGHTAKKIYKYWSNINPWPHSKMKYCLSDERVVKENDINSNFGMVKNILLTSEKQHKNLFNLNQNLEISRLEIKYNEFIKSKIDLVLLSLGEDGHFASIFPKTEHVYSHQTIIETEHGNMKRISLTYQEIKKSDKLYILVSGKKKGEVGKPINKSLNNVSYDKATKAHTAIKLN